MAIKFKLNYGQFNRFRNSGAVTAHLEDVADGIAARANAQVTDRAFPEDGDPFVVQTHHRNTRVHVIVYTNGFDGEMAEAKDRALSRVLPAS